MGTGWPGLLAVFTPTFLPSDAEFFLPLCFRFLLQGCGMCRKVIRKLLVYRCMVLWQIFYYELAITFLNWTHIPALVHGIEDKY